MDSGSSVFQETLANALARLGVSIGLAQLSTLERHFASMVEANRSMNLTRITDPAAAAIKHYADSLALLAWAAGTGIGAAKLLDIGTGAGFPAVPLAVMRPDWSITAIDGTRKKTDFLRQFVRGAELKNLRVEHGHSDHWRSGRRFDIVTARAVAPLAEFMETARPHLASKGRLIAYKTRDIDAAELADADLAAKRLGMTKAPSHEYELEFSGERMARSLWMVIAN